MVKSYWFAVQKREEALNREIEAIQDSVRHMYKMDLMRYPTATKNMLWIDYINKVSTEVACE